MWRAITVILFLFSIGCSSPMYERLSQSIQIGITIKETTEKVRFVELTREKAYEFFVPKGSTNSPIRMQADGLYCAMDENWFTNNVLVEYNQFLTQLQLENRYSYEKNDCDDYARSFTFFCRLKSLRIPDIKYSMPVADIFYHVNGSQLINHAINAVIVLTKDGKLKIIYIEPQTPAKLLESSYTNITKNIYYLAM